MAAVEGAGNSQDALKRVRPESEAFMMAAAASAKAGIHIGHGGPFGAAVVKDGILLSCAHNTVLHNGDATCHAEMNAIRQACVALQSHDLSDCELFTTCEPCPMCWGAIQWSRLPTIHVGVDRYTAAKYGFDDKVFYDEVEAHSGHYGVHLQCSHGHKGEAAKGIEGDKAPTDKSMLHVYDGLLEHEAEGLFTNKLINRTHRRRYGSASTGELAKAAEQIFEKVPKKKDACTDAKPAEDPIWVKSEEHMKYMRMAIDVATEGARKGGSKEREPFGAVVVRVSDGAVLGKSCNTVLAARDATATAEVQAIRQAAAAVGDHNLSGCRIYCTAEPDLMSLGAILWSRIPEAYVGVSQKLAAQWGFEEGLMHFQDLAHRSAGLPDGGSTEVLVGVHASGCEDVFKEWSELNGVLY